LFTKNSSWQSKQSIPPTTVMFYGDCAKMCEYFAPNFGDKRTGCCCITTTRCLTLPFSPGNFWPKTTWLISHPSNFFSLTEDKTERPPFWHSWDDRGRITGDAEHPHRTRKAETLGMLRTRKVNTSSVIVASMLKVIFWPDAGISPGNYGSFRYTYQA
jgi:hypothetical protein